MPITTTAAQTSVKKIYENSFSLNPSALLQLFEIDISSISDLSVNTSELQIFRFHNNLKYTSNNIIFKGNTYIAAPIAVDGFEVSSKGTLPTPKLSLTVNEAGIETFALFKSKLAELGDLTGAKVTRIRTFAKYIDATNWAPDQIPDDFSPDSIAEFPRDVYYIDRKSFENKLSLQFELGSILDVEGVQLPARLMFAKRCVFQYRGEGCCYENSYLRNPDTHGNAILPFSAPPVATELDEKISTIIGGAVIKSAVKYDPTKLSSYVVGSTVYLTHNGINYHFVCKVNSPSAAPPNMNYWVTDQCSKLISGCRLRWGANGTVNVLHTNLVKGNLPFGGFPAANRIDSQG